MLGLERLLKTIQEYWGFVGVFLAVWLSRWRVDQLSYERLKRLGEEWRAYGEDRDKLLVSIREELNQVRRSLNEEKDRCRKIYEHNEQLAKDCYLRDRYIRQLVQTLRHEELPIPPKEYEE